MTMSDGGLYSIYGDYDTFYRCGCKWGCSSIFGLSGPIGLALAICLAVNLWPALGHGSRT